MNLKLQEVIRVLEVSNIANQGRLWGLATGLVENQIMVQEALRKNTEHTREATLKAVVSTLTATNLMVQEVIRVSEVVYLASLGFRCILMQLPDS